MRTSGPGEKRSVELAGTGCRVLVRSCHVTLQRGSATDYEAVRKVVTATPATIARIINSSANQTGHRESMISTLWLKPTAERTGPLHTIWNSEKELELCGVVADAAELEHPGRSVNASWERRSARHPIPGAFRPGR